MRRRRHAPQEVPRHLLLFDAADWPATTEDDARAAWRDAGLEWCRSTGFDVVHFLRQKSDARRAAAGLPPVDR